MSCQLILDRYNFKFLFLYLIFLSISFITAQSSSCSIYNDCFNCTSEDQCEWVNNICQNSLNSTASIQQWFKKFTPCLVDPPSMVQINNYCGLYHTNYDLPITLSLYMVNRTFFSNNLYCRWEIIPKEGETVIVNFTRNKNDKNLNSLYSVEYTYTDNTESQTSIDNYDYYLSSSILKRIIFHYHAGKANEDDRSILPFFVTISYNKELTIFDIIIIIIIVILCSFLSVLLVVMGYQCCLSILKRRATQNDENTHQNDNNLENQLEDRKKEQTEHNKKMLDEIIKPIEYEENHGEVYGNICTVCFENFQPHSQVVTLYCKHMFHETCLRQWCERTILHPKCPNCNLDIIRVKSEEENMLVLNTNLNVATHNAPTQRETDGNANNVPVNSTDNILRIPRVTHPRENESNTNMRPEVTSDVNQN